MSPPYSPSCPSPDSPPCLCPTFFPKPLSTPSLSAEDPTSLFPEKHRHQEGPLSTSHQTPRHTCLSACPPSFPPVSAEEATCPPSWLLDPVLWAPWEHPSHQAQASPIFNTKAKAFLSTQLCSLPTHCTLHLGSFLLPRQVSWES